MAPRHIMVERDRIHLGIESHDPLDDPSALGTHILALGVLTIPEVFGLACQGIKWSMQQEWR